MRKLFDGKRLVVLAGAAVVAAAVALTGQLGTSPDLGARTANDTCVGMQTFVGTGCAQPTATQTPPTPTPAPAGISHTLLLSNDSGLPMQDSVADLSTRNFDNVAIGFDLAPYSAIAVFSEPNFKGACTTDNTWDQGHHVDLPASQARNVSSVLYGPGDPGPTGQLLNLRAACGAGLVLYPAANYQGTPVFVSSGQTVPPSLQGKAMSARMVGSLVNGAQPLQMWSGVGTWPSGALRGTGTCSKIWGDVPDLSALSVGSQAAFVAYGACDERDQSALLSHTIGLFSAGVYGGTPRQIDSDVPDLAALGFDNRALSYKVAGTYSVALYADANYKGHCTTATGQADYITATAVGDLQVSSVKLFATCYDGQQLVSDPETFSNGNQIYAFARAGDNTLWMRRYAGTKWLGTESLGGTLTSGAAAASMGAPRVDVFVRGPDGALYQKYYDGQWKGWFKLTPDNTITSDPAAVSWGLNRLDVFARGATGRLVHVWWGGNGWVIDPEGYLGDLYITGSPAVASWGQGRLDVFVRTNGNSLFRKTFDGQWRAWQNMGDGIVQSDVAAVSWGLNRIDVFWKGSNNALQHVVVNGDQWSMDPENYLGGSLVSGPSVSSRGANKLDVFARTADGMLSEKSFDGAWLAWQAVS